MMTASNKQKYEAKVRLVNAGESKVFADWHHFFGVSKADFLKELKWLMEDTGFKREIAIDANNDAIIRARLLTMTPQQVAMFGECYDKDNCKVRIAHLTRYKDARTDTVYFLDENGWRFFPQYSLSPRDFI